MRHQIHTGKLKLLLIFMFFLLLFCCEEKGKSVIEKDTRIVILNTSNFTRTEIGNFIIEINKCNPIVIGLTETFPLQKGDKGDSSLAKSIKDSGKIILSAAISSSDEIVRSHVLFTNAAKEQGVVSYIIGEDNIIEYFVPLYQNNEGQELNMSFNLYFAYDPENAASAFGKFIVNETYKINYSRNRNSFVELDPKDLSCDNIQDKIVILGYLGPDKTNMVTTPDGSQTYLTVVIATVLSNFLDQDPLIPMKED